MKALDDERSLCLAADQLYVILLFPKPFSRMACQCKQNAGCCYCKNPELLWDACDLSSPNPQHITGRSGRGTRRGFGAALGRTGSRQNRSPKRRASLVPPKASKTCLLNNSPKARTSENLCTPIENNSLCNILGSNVGQPA